MVMCVPSVAPCSLLADHVMQQSYGRQPISAVGASVLVSTIVAEHLKEFTAGSDFLLCVILHSNPQSGYVEVQGPGKPHDNLFLPIDQVRAPISDSPAVTN